MAESEENKKQHGGARPGAGRKPIFDGPVMRKSINLPESARAEIEARAENAGVSVHQWLALTILEELERPA